MASPVRVKVAMTPMPMLPAMLFLAEDAFSNLCIAAARRLLPDLHVTVAEPSCIEDMIAAQHPGLVVRPSQEPQSRAISIEADIAARAAGAMYLPMVASGSQLFVGPLFGPERSCASCWSIRQSRLRARISSLKTTIEQSETPETPQIRATLASIAISAMVSLLYRESKLFTSLYFAYNAHSRQVHQGTLTSTHECRTCRQHFRDIERDNGALRQLILMHVHANQTTEPTPHEP